MGNIEKCKREVKHLISGQVDMGTFGLVEMEINKLITMKPDYYVLESINGIPYIFKEKHLAEHVLNSTSWSVEKKLQTNIIEVFKK